MTNSVAAMDKITILLVEDHPLFRQGLREALTEDEAIEVIGESEDGIDALDQVRRLRPQIAVMDVNLPGQNGIQVCRTIRNDRLETAVVILTAYDDAEQIIHAFRAGAYAYCPKEITPRRLIETLRQVAQGHYVVGDQLFDKEGIEAWLDKKVSQVNRPYMDETQEAFSPLSPREMEILQYVTRGMSNKEIAYALGISHQTVKNHMTAILQKLDVEDRTQAAVYALRHGWVRLQDTQSN